MSDQLEQALALIGSEPLPADAEAKLAAMEAAAPFAERDQFADLWEALLVRLPVPTLDPD